MKQKYKYTPLLTINELEKLVKKFIISDKLCYKNTPCWIWDKCISNCGYGRIKINYKEYLAHRVMYAQIKGRIPDGLQIDHLCRNRACISPVHLEPVTNKENSRRGINRNRDKTNCPRGHEFNESNTYIRPFKNYTDVFGRECRECRADAARRFRIRHKL